MPLSVIGAGASRTGTHSLKLALEQLGFGPCHHFFAFLQDQESLPLWEQVFEGKAPDWADVYADYRSGVDAPTVWFYAELAERFPEAKVVLTHRTPESWLKSVQKTVSTESNFQLLMSTPAAPVIAKMGPFLAKRGTLLDPSLAVRDPELAIKNYLQHNEEVKRTIPPERLLVYEVKQGWGPLCRFLDVPVPDTPFPRSNSTDEFLDMLKTGELPR